LDDCSANAKRRADGNVDPVEVSADDANRTDDDDRDKGGSQTIFNDARARFVSDETAQNGFHRKGSFLAKRVKAKAQPLLPFEHLAAGHYEPVNTLLQILANP
jgi:hypothetical protein